MMNTMHLDCHPDKLQEYSIGDEVTIVVKGKVTELRDGKDPDAKPKKNKDGLEDYEPNASIAIDVESKSIMPGKMFAKLVDEDEDY